MEQFLQGELVAKILLVVIGVNIGLSALQAALEKVKDHTGTEIDNKAHAILSTVLGYVQKIVDFISANRQHKG